MPNSPPVYKPFYSSLLLPLFANNAQVYYKKGTLSWSIGSTVRNSGAVRKRT